MAVDVEKKYLYNSFPYLGKDESRDTSVSLPSYIVTKLMQPIFKRGYNVTCDNFFTSLDVALRLAEQKSSIFGGLSTRYHAIFHHATVNYGYLITRYLIA